MIRNIFTGLAAIFLGAVALMGLAFAQVFVASTLGMPTDDFVVAFVILLALGLVVEAARRFRNF
jgi:hypothetical protein